MTDETTIHLGIQAETLLGDESFNALYTHIVDDIGRQILATSLVQADERDQLYHTYNGLRYFVNNLVHLKNQKDAIFVQKEREAAQDIEETANLFE